MSNKPTLEYTIHTIASIGHVKWRPQRKYHIASCALVIDCSINIWDVRRPYIPFASFNEHKDIASGVAWRGDPHIFLSSGRVSTIFLKMQNESQQLLFRIVRYISIISTMLLVLPAKQILKAYQWISLAKFCSLVKFLLLLLTVPSLVTIQIHWLKQLLAWWGKPKEYVFITTICSRDIFNAMLQMVIIW